MSRSKLNAPSHPGNFGVGQGMNAGGLQRVLITSGPAKDPQQGEERVRISKFQWDPQEISASGKEIWTPVGGMSGDNKGGNGGTHAKNPGTVGYCFQTDDQNYVYVCDAPSEEMSRSSQNPPTGPSMEDKNHSAKQWEEDWYSEEFKVSEVVECDDRTTAERIMLTARTSQFGAKDQWDEGVCKHMAGGSGKPRRCAKDAFRGTSVS